ncbi:MAG: ParB/RepB/Spo0J family partition protein [Intestinibacillus sp.]
MAKNLHKSGLGKGLTDLFGGEQMVDAAETETLGVSTLPLGQIEPNRGQPRKVFDPAAMEELTESIRRHGVVTPITVRKQENGRYQIIAGERRWRAARAAGLLDIPAMVLDVSDEQVMELALIENLQRQDLNPIEEAEGYDVLQKDFGMTQDRIAERVGRSRSAIANAMRLLALDKDVRQMVAEGRLSSGHARAVLSIQDESVRAEAAKKMEKLSVRQAESLARRLNKTPREEQPADAFSVDYIAELEKKLESMLGRRVRIENGKNRGTLSLEFYGDEDLERLSDALATVRI